MQDYLHTYTQTGARGAHEPKCKYVVHKKWMIFHGKHTIFIWLIKSGIPLRSVIGLLNLFKANGLTVFKWIDNYASSKLRSARIECVWAYFTFEMRFFHSNNNKCQIIQYQFPILSKNPFRARHMCVRARKALWVGGRPQPMRKGFENWNNNISGKTCDASMRADMHH